MSDLPGITPDPAAATPDPGQPGTGAGPQAGANATRMMVPVSQLTAHHQLSELRESFSQFRGQVVLDRLRSVIMFDPDERPRDLAGLIVAGAGVLRATGHPAEPYRLLDADGVPVEAAGVYFRDLLAGGRSPATVRSYGLDLLRWFRFTWAVDVPWQRATRVEARDFCRWMQLAPRPGRVHWRKSAGPGGDAVPRAAGGAYAVSVRVHSETVLRGFYDFHLNEGSGPVINPFPLDRSRAGKRALAHHNPMERYRGVRTGRYRPKVASRIPRSITDDEFNEIFARLPSHRDRALVAFYVSTGARASELLSVTQSRADPGRRVIAVIRKGSGELQELPASSDAFVWLRLYQAQMGDLVPRGRRQPLWWTLRRPFRPLTYHAAHRMFERAAAIAGSGATLHSLRHTAAFRMAEDPALPLTDVQYVLGHAQLTTTQIYLTPRKEDVIRRLLDHHAGQVRQAAARRVALPAPGYEAGTLAVLFGQEAL
jgi:integrase